MVSLDFASVVILVILSTVISFSAIPPAIVSWINSTTSKNERSSPVLNFANGDSLSSKDFKMAGIPVALPSFSFSSFTVSRYVSWFTIILNV